MFITACAVKRSNERRRHATDAVADNLVVLIRDILHSTRGVEFSANAAGACDL